MQRVFTTIAMLIACVLWQGCIKDCTPAPQDCIPTITTITRTVNGADKNTGSTYYNQPVVKFNLEQWFYYFSHPNTCTFCSEDFATVKLQLQNTTNKTIHFSYSLLYTRDMVNWSYQNTATIAPNGSYNVGDVSANASDVSQGNITVQLSNITYN